ncbi:alpha/beta hydrolase [Mucilaginibacter sp. PAMB04168]|uniref:alpha/beta hydrolase n=1 Tax=Mucilaginibacter sp. PAMB04168 TaxID=3138567 RepID=UPI00332F956F
MLAILVSEYGLLFIGVTVLVLLSGLWIKKYQVLGTAAGIITVALLLLPIVKAYNVGTNLKADIDRAFLFCGKPAKTFSSAFKPFTFSKLFQKDPQSAFQTLKYVSYPDTSLTLDYYKSNATGKRPCIVVIHGGSWSSGDSRQLPELNAMLSQSGYQVASINYRLAPRWKSPAPVQDVKAALTYLRKHAGQLQIDTGKIILLGRSAGAQIALLAAYTVKQQGIKGVIDFYGPADMVWGYSVPAPKLIMDSRGVMANYLDGYYPKVPQNYAGSSPIRYVSVQSVPTLIIHGGNDVLVAYEHSRRLSEKLKQNGVPHYWLQLPWATHGFDHHLNGPGGQLSTFAVQQFLRQIL